MVPSAEIDGSVDDPMPPPGARGLGARDTVFVRRSITNTSSVSGWSPGTRSVAMEVNATNVPSAETDGWIEPALRNGALGPAFLRDTRSVLPGGGGSAPGSDRVAVRAARVAAAAGVAPSWVPIRLAAAAPDVAVTTSDSSRPATGRCLTQASVPDVPGVQHGRVARLGR